MSQTPEERREAQIDAMDATKTHPTLSPRFIAEECLDNLLAHLDEHQPLTAKLLREGDPKGPIADAIRYGADFERNPLTEQPFNTIAVNWPDDHTNAH